MAQHTAGPAQNANYFCSCPARTRGGGRGVVEVQDAPGALPRARAHKHDRVRVRVHAADERQRAVPALVVARRLQLALQQLRKVGGDERLAGIHAARRRASQAPAASHPLGQRGLSALVIAQRLQFALQQKQIHSLAVLQQLYNISRRQHLAAVYAAHPGAKQDLDQCAHSPDSFTGETIASLRWEHATSALRTLQYQHICRKGL